MLHDDAFLGLSLKLISSSLSGVIMKTLCEKLQAIVEVLISNKAFL